MSLNSLSESTFEMSVPAFTQAQNHFVELSMALLLEACGNWSHVGCVLFRCSDHFADLLDRPEHFRRSLRAI